MGESVGLPTSTGAVNPLKAKQARQEFEALAHRLAAPLKAMAFRLAYPDQDLAEDLVQIALVKGYQLFLEGRFHPEIGAYSWFTAVIENDFRAHRRKSRRVDETVAGQMALEAAEASGPDPHESFLQGRIEEPIRAWLGELPPEQRACIELIDLNGLDYREAARIEGVPVGTIRSRLARARLKLAARFETEETTP